MLIHFKIKAIDEDTYNSYEDEGFTYGETLNQAVARLEQWYGTENICELQVDQFEDVINFDELKELLKENI